MVDNGEDGRLEDFHSRIVATLRTWDNDDNEDSIADEIVDHHRVVFGSNEISDE